MRLILNREALAGMFAEDDGAASKALAIRAEMVATAAKRLCPVDTGRLRASIQVIHGHDEKGPLALVGTNVEYAIYVELGTRFMSAQPFLRPAAHVGGDAIVHRESISAA